MGMTNVCVLIALACAPFAAGAPVPTHLMPKGDAKGWQKRESGLEVMEVKVGAGEPVKPGANVVVHYTGWLTDEKGTKFDSSRDRGMRAEFPLTGLIKGWQEGMVGMKPGGVRKLKIPAHLGYGERGAGASVPPKAVLVFEIELFEAK